MRISMIALAAGLAAAGAGGVIAGTELIDFPDGYRSGFVRYTTVDKPERKPPIVRFMYANPDALAAAKAGQDMPHGTVLVMEDHRAKLDGDGAPVKDAKGRLVPTDEVTSIFVQEKRAGWGAEYPAEKRNGEWEYAWFEPSGARRSGPNVSLDGCFKCHKENAAPSDFNFTFAAFVKEIKK